MRIRDHTHAAAAILLVGVVALFARTVPWPGHESLAVAVHPPVPPAGSNARVRFDGCLQNVGVIHDLYWASACSVVAAEKKRQRTMCLETAPSSRDTSRDTSRAPACEPDNGDDDDSPDCMLPEDRARRLNEARATAEQECLDEATGDARNAALLRP